MSLPTQIDTCRQVSSATRLLIRGVALPMCLHFLRQLQKASRSYDSDSSPTLRPPCHTAIELAGPYVWNDVYDLLVLPPSFPYGGMEVGLGPATQTEGQLFNALPRRTCMYMVGSCGLVAAPAGLQGAVISCCAPARGWVQPARGPGCRPATRLDRQSCC